MYINTKGGMHMSLEAFLFRRNAGKSDKIRDSRIPLPEGVTECRNISYDQYGVWSQLDVYYPTGTTEQLPTIVNIHGGGYVYGTKEIYRRYGMELARHGFAVVSFNYRLAPKWKFPTPIYDTNTVMGWICRNALRYHLDPSRIILVGDSAGAQLASQYAAIATNPQYASLFQLTVPPITIRCLGLNCGMYDMTKRTASPRKGVQLDYLGKHLPDDDPRFRVLESVTCDYPPAYITTSCKDFLRPCAKPMYDFLTAKGIDAAWKCYGTEDNEEVGHVFHVNIILPEAIACNEDSIRFFRKHL